MNDHIEPCHVMSREKFSELSNRRPASEATVMRRSLVDDIRSMKGPYPNQAIERVKARQAK